MYDVIVGFSVNPEVTWTDIVVEAGDQKLLANAELAVSGSSLDVALTLRACDCPVKLMGAVGKDDPFNMLIETELGKLGINHYSLPVRERTCLASIEPEAERHLSFKPPIIEVDVGLIESVVFETKPKFRIVTGLMPDPNEMIMAQALLTNKCAGIRILNPRQALTVQKDLFETMAYSADYLFLNRFEAAVYLDRDPENLELSSLAPFLELGLDLVVVTQDGKGVMAIDQSGWNSELSIFEPAKKSLVCEKGAGDCFLGFFVACLLKGYDRQTSFQIARIAAGLKVCMPGTTNVPTFDEVIAVFDNGGK